MTTFVNRFTGTFTGPWELGDGTVLQPTGKSFDLLYSTTAKWRTAASSMNTSSSTTAN